MIIKSVLTLLATIFTVSVILQLRTFSLTVRSAVGSKVEINPYGVFSQLQGAVM